MKSASQMSMEIRAKKKKMMEDRGVIDSGGSPSMDLQDEDIMERESMTKDLGLDHNDPMHTPDDPDEMPMAEHREELEKPNHQGEHQTTDDAGIEEKMLKRKARVMKMMGR